MSLLVIVLIATVLLPRLLEPGVGAATIASTEVPIGLAAVAGIVPQLLIAGAALVAGRHAVAQLKRGRGGAPNRLRIRLRRLQWAAVLSQAVAVQAFGWLAMLREVLGDLPALDELISLLPAIGAIGACWWAAHPMEKLLRPALAGRRRYVAGELRNQLAILGVPAILAIATLETGDLLATRVFSPESPMAWAIVPGALLLLMVFAPVAMVRVLDTANLPDGTGRRMVDRVLRDNGLSVRRVLVWRTGGSLLNGAVVGVLHPWRYLLLTDAVLAMMSSDSLRAIVAHEVGHLRRRHLPWLVVVATAIVGAAGLTAEAVAMAVAKTFAADPDDPLVQAVAGGEVPARATDPMVEIAIPITVAAIVAFFGIGWVSRRFERQADTFAVQYLSATAASGGEEAAEATDEARGPRIRSAAVLSMCRALGRVAELNGVDPAAPSWRHGSIQSRQRHLVDLLGQPSRRLRIDRQVVAIKSCGVAILLAVIAFELHRGEALPGGESRPGPVAESSATPG